MLLLFVFTFLPSPTAPSGAGALNHHFVFSLKHVFLPKEVLRLEVNEFCHKRVGRCDCVAIVKTRKITPVLRIWPISSEHGFVTCKSGYRSSALRAETGMSSQRQKIQGRGGWFCLYLGAGGGVDLKEKKERSVDWWQPAELFCCPTSPFPLLNSSFVAVIVVWRSSEERFSDLPGSVCQ